MELPQPRRGGIRRTRLGDGQADDLISPLWGSETYVGLQIPRLPPWATRYRPLRGLSSASELRLRLRAVGLGSAGPPLGLWVAGVDQFHRGRIHL